MHLFSCCVKHEQNLPGWSHDSGCLSAERLTKAGKKFYGKDWNRLPIGLRASRLGCQCSDYYDLSGIKGHKKCGAQDAACLYCTACNNNFGKAIKSKLKAEIRAFKNGERDEYYAHLLQTDGATKIESDRKGFTINGKKDKTESKKRSKFQDWVYKTVSCCNGCINDCVYCFARGDAVNKKRLKLTDWPLSKIRQHDVDKKYKLFKTPVMFPGTHDIYAENFDACMTVLGKLLDAGNRVLVVSKPRYDIIVEIEKQFSKFRNNLLFRFTIGAKNDDNLSLWEPQAPSYEERKKSMAYLFDKGYRTSVSIEPMLEPTKTVELVNDLGPHVNHSIWIGTMNHLWYFETEADAAKTKAAKIRVQNNLEYYGSEKAAKIRVAAEKIIAGQSAENLKDIYDQLKDNPLVRWKWHIKHALGLPQPDSSEPWPED